MSKFDRLQGSEPPNLGIFPALVETEVERDQALRERDELLEAIAVAQRYLRFGRDNPVADLAALNPVADLAALADRIKGGDDAARVTDASRRHEDDRSTVATRGEPIEQDGLAPNPTSLASNPDDATSEPKTCPTCGSPVRVHHGDEGTSHYVPELQANSKQVQNLDYEKELRGLLEWAKREQKWWREYRDDYSTGRCTSMTRLRDRIESLPNLGAVGEGR